MKATTTKVEILQPKSRSNYTEIAQDKPIRMAYAQKVKEGVFQKLHPSVICRDYFGDALYSEQEKKDTSVYGFRWGPVEHPERVLDRDKTRLCFKCPKEDDLINFEKNLSILNEVEKANKLELTVFFPSKNHEEILVEGDAKWMSSIFLISLYTFLLKCMCYELKKSDWMNSLTEYQTKEAHYLRTREKLFPKILKNLAQFGFDKESKNVPVHGWENGDPGITTVHNYSGWHTLSSWGNTDDAGINKRNYFRELVKQLAHE